MPVSLWRVCRLHVGEPCEYRESDDAYTLAATPKITAKPVQESTNSFSDVLDDLFALHLQSSIQIDHRKNSIFEPMESVVGAELDDSPVLSLQRPILVRKQVGRRSNGQGLVQKPVDPKDSASLLGLQQSTQVSQRFFSAEGPDVNAVSMLQPQPPVQADQPVADAASNVVSQQFAAHVQPVFALGLQRHLTGMSMEDIAAVSGSVSLSQTSSVPTNSAPLLGLQRFAKVRRRVVIEEDSDEGNPSKLMRPVAIERKQREAAAGADSTYGSLLGPQRFVSVARRYG